MKNALIKVLKISGAALTALLLVIIVFDLWISLASRQYLYDEISSIPNNRVGLLLGTSQFLKTGIRNPYFENRIQAAADLYKEGKIRYVIASGDNREMYYNEPRKMKEALLKVGIPERAIIQDFAGLRTLDSVIRCSRVFGQEKFTVISQKFHNERAVFIARRNGIKAIAFNAEEVDFPESVRTGLREYLARFKAVLDVFILAKEPRHLGEKIEIK